MNTSQLNKELRTTTFRILKHWEIRCRAQRDMLGHDQTLLIDMVAILVVSAEATRPSSAALLIASSVSLPECMDGWCNVVFWLFVRECAHVHYYMKFPTIWATSDKHTNAFSQNRLFCDMPKPGPNPSEKQHRKNCMVGHDEQVKRRVNIGPRRNQGPSLEF